RPSDRTLWPRVGFGGVQHGVDGGLRQAGSRGELQFNAQWDDAPYDSVAELLRLRLAGTKGEMRGSGLKGNLGDLLPSPPVKPERSITRFHRSRILKAEMNHASRLEPLSLKKRCLEGDGPLHSPSLDEPTDESLGPSPVTKVDIEVEDRLFPRCQRLLLE